MTTRWYWSLVFALLAAGGCASQVERSTLPVEVPDGFSTTGPAALEAKWWESFEDEALNQLVDEALSGNFDLQIAWDRLNQAQAVARRTDSSWWPTLDFAAGASRLRRDDSSGVTETSSHSVGVAAGYEIDLWGQLSSTRRAAWLDAEAEREAVDTASITLAASIAQTWYRLAEAKALARIAGEQIETNTKVLEIVVVQFRKALASAADVLRQRQLVAATEGQLISAQETIDVLQYELAILLGRSPELAWGQTAIDIPDMPRMPALGVPTQVLWRRPDVRQRHRLLEAADQRLAAAIADQYPRLSISADVSMTAGSRVRDLFDDWLANLAANAVGPIFDADFRKAEVQRNEAVVSERLHTWGSTTIDAIGEIETALTQQRQQQFLLENLRRQLELARETYARNRDSFINSQVDYIRVLESLQSLQALERSEATAMRTVIQRRIELYRATAGSFDPPRPESAPADDDAETKVQP